MRGSLVPPFSHLCALFRSLFRRHTLGRRKLNGVENAIDDSIGTPHAVSGLCSSQKLVYHAMPCKLCIWSISGHFYTATAKYNGAARKAAKKAVGELVIDINSVSYPNPFGRCDKYPIDPSMNSTELDKGIEHLREMVQMHFREDFSSRGTLRTSERLLNYTESCKVFMHQVIQIVAAF
ncbi:hypothetical protein B0H13DRAFT_1912327 [Mycena leptocephala]|nr:hypothetical protein B0H13DRAFT_1912327 [Mycena leptocephala]